MAHDIQTLITVVNRILQEDRVLNDQKKALVESLLEKVISLKELLEKSVALQHGLRGSSKEIIQELQREIRDAAHEAEDIIESHALDQMLLYEPEATRSVIYESHTLHQTHHMRSFLKSLLKKVTSLKTMMQRLLRCNNCTSSRSNKEIIQESQNEMVRDAVDCSIIQVMEKFDAANDKLTNIIKLQSHDEGETTMDVISNPSLSIAADPTMMVGFEEDKLRLKGRLTSDRRKREIIPIVGMGGIGKTTLARNLYNDPLVVSHFDVRVWVTVSQDYSVQAILLGLLGITSKKDSDDMDCSELGKILHQRLYGSRYLVVLDDIWSENAWDEIQRYFPKQESRSRILITSRELHVAKHADSACKEHQMHLLSDAQGWDLLRRKVFEIDEHCPPVLEEIGRKIASSCGGLPLAISVIGGLLSAEKHSKNLWDKVARDVRSITNNHISEILCLSYDNLPLHLKPCFLYMSAFPEDFKVRHSKLVKMLVAEGFLWRSNGENNKSWEDVAEEYLKSLVDRNLLSVTRTMYNGRVESYSMHDLLRDLCVRKADDEKFFRIFKYGNVNNFRRVSIHQQFTYVAPGLVEDLSCSRSLLYISPIYDIINISSILSALRLVRVLYIYDIFSYSFPKEILNLANLRFLAINIYRTLPSEIWGLRNLQTLLVQEQRRCHLDLPVQAWEISSLRHIILKYGFLYIRVKIPRVQENIQTISFIHLGHLLDSNLITNMPNIKKLGICSYYELNDINRVIDLSHLHKLETLKLRNFRGVDALSHLQFPIYLKKLSLADCVLPMGLVNGVDELQYLEVLKIVSCDFQSKEHKDEEEEDTNKEEEDVVEEEEEEEEEENIKEEEDAVEEEDEDDTKEEEDIVEEEDDDDSYDSSSEEEDDNQEWEVNEGVEFCSLQFLWLQNLRIKRWKAEYSHFPILRHLRIEYCQDLKEFPACIAETSALELIEVDRFNRHLVNWANEVLETQRHEYGNEILQIRFIN